MLKIIKSGELSTALPSAVDQPTLEGARTILDRLRSGGEPALRAAIAQFEQRPADARLTYAPLDFTEALNRIPSEQVELLRRVAGGLRVSLGPSAKRWPTSVCQSLVGERDIAGFRCGRRAVTSPAGGFRWSRAS